jgi:hypothetical protein
LPGTGPEIHVWSNLIDIPKTLETRINHLSPIRSTSRPLWQHPSLAPQPLPRIVASWQNAETLGEQYRFHPLGQREGLNRYFGAVKSLCRTF